MATAIVLDAWTAEQAKAREIEWMRAEHVALLDAKVGRGLYRDNEELTIADLEPSRREDRREGTSGAW